MNKLKIYLWSFLLIALVLNTNAIESLQSFWQPVQQTYSVSKGGSIDISYYITNRESFTISCTVTSSDSSATYNINAKSTQYFSKRYSAPNKIKNLQNPLSYEIIVYCYGNYPIPYGCGFLGFSTCYNYEKREFLQKQAVQITLNLNSQDQKNLNILEDYRASVSDIIKRVDQKDVQINELLTKTPKPLLPLNLDQDISTLRNSLEPVKAVFQNVINSLEEEQYNFASNTNKQLDLLTLENSEKKLSEISNSVNINIEKYNVLIKELNNELSDTKLRIKELNYKFNTQWISEMNDLGEDVFSKISNYKFTDLEEATNLINQYAESKNKTLSQMENNLRDYTLKGNQLLISQSQEICTKFNLCATKIKVDNSDEEKEKFIKICELFVNLNSEVESHNSEENKRYKSEIEELENKNNEIRNKNIPIQQEIDRINSLNTQKESLNSKSREINKIVSESVLETNLIGKNMDTSYYKQLVMDYNNLAIDKKENKLKELEVLAKNISLEKEKTKNLENKFTSFFKKTYNKFFGDKQDVPKINLEEKEQLPSLIIEYPNTILAPKVTNISQESFEYISIFCKDSEEKLNDLLASSLNLQISDKQSQLKTTIVEAEKNCFDENGKRTNRCCDSDDYKSKKELYPVIFIHGHSFEESRGDLQSSLDTFKYMSQYFSKKGYVEKSILYPESSEELVKGSWAFCDKPVVVRLTYYDGLSSGTTHNYRSGIAAYSPTLKKEIDAVLKATNKDKAIIVSHSMGGILSRYYIKFDGGSNKIYKLITIGSPHYGIRAFASFWSPLGATESQQMTPDSEFLKTLNNPLDSIVPTYTISGKTVNSNTCFNAPCDSVVYVESSKLKQESGSITFTGDQYEHNLMVSQPEVAEQVLKFIKS